MKNLRIISATLILAFVPIISFAQSGPPNETLLGPMRQGAMGQTQRDAAARRAKEQYHPLTKEDRQRYNDPMMGITRQLRPTVTLPYPITPEYRAFVRSSAEYKLKTLRMKEKRLREEAAELFERAGNTSWISWVWNGTKQADELRKSASELLKRSEMLRKQIAELEDYIDTL